VSAGSITLGEAAEHTAALTVACTRCDRAGKYRLETLIARHGVDFGIPDLVPLLSKDCVKRASVSAYDLCGVHCPELPVLFLGKEPDRPERQCAFRRSARRRRRATAPRQGRPCPVARTMRCADRGIPSMACRPTVSSPARPWEPLGAVSIAAVPRMLIAGKPVDPIPYLRVPKCDHAR
jgi:hypothetical protein